MKNVADMQYNKLSEKLVDVLCRKTQYNNHLFFRNLVAYYFSKLASTMRTDIKTKDRGTLPVNMYVINLSLSGTGKGYASSIMEDRVIDGFKKYFMENTFPVISEENLAKISVKRANRKQSDPDEELEKVSKEFVSLGTLAFSFDSGTTAAIKQMRHKLLMANIGSINTEIDEIGLNLLGNTEIINTFLELFDLGKIKNKLTKNTAENTRSEEIDGKTPTNMLLFGTPAKLLNGSKTEEEFYSLLENGYARRCFFGYSKNTVKQEQQTPEEVYASLIDNDDEATLEDANMQLTNLADCIHYGKTIEVSKEVSILLIEYRQQCELKADELSDYQEIRKAELVHRYFKAIKLAGVYAFIDNTLYMTKEHLYSAIKLVEDSGEAFNSLLTRDRNYVKLANYIATVGKEITHVDLVEDLPFYKGSESQRRELMSLAIAYGYKNNIIIKKQYSDGIEFLTGESLKETDINQMTISYSMDLAYNYENSAVPFTHLHKLTQSGQHHWINHSLKGQHKQGHRNEENCEEGFNLIVLDIDDGISLELFHTLMVDYTYLTHTTKSHTESTNRFRAIFPISHQLFMGSEEYKEFMNNIYDWLPFAVDAQTNQRSRKWATFNGDYHYNKGDLLNALLFIPKTSKNEERENQVASYHSLNNLERWFCANTMKGNRSKQMIRYALILVDMGLDIDSIRNNVLALNSKLADGLEEAEILATIMVTANSRLIKRNQ